MISCTVDLERQTRRTSTEESTTVSLGSDVLFASSAADLTAEADQVITDAALVIQDHEPGEVQVVGHTDDVDEDAYNLDLSRRPAQAVADALGARIDTTRYPLAIDGTGESAPVASNTTSAGKAMNRRVELTIRTPETSTAPEGANAPNAFDGPTSTAPDPVAWADGSVELEFRAEEARIITGHLVVTVSLTRTDGEIDSIFGPGNQSGTVEMPEGIADDKSHFDIAVIDGSVAHLSVAHALGGPRRSNRPLTDSQSTQRLDSGEPRVVELI
ncbi:OmpA family protein [Brachybacterium sp. AOP25-B2-12]|uniref:OmpA family protein n=1 Tax=Brachybacterium sp. AOP25-B2-12 TaxID=3457710 RepID=UPI00403359C0